MPKISQFERRFAAIAMALVCLPAWAQNSGLPSAPSPPTPQASVADQQMPPVAGTELDRVVAIVNGDLILDSDVDEERRFESLQPYRDTDAVFSRTQAIERLINRDLILQQAALQQQGEIGDEDVKKEIDALRKQIPACKQYHCETQTGWDSFLADHGFTEDSFTERWQERMVVLRFIEQRFRAGIKISADEIKTYYEKTMLPEYAKQQASAPKLDVVSDRIQEVLLERRVSDLLSDWLKSLRAQGSVVVLHPGEEAP